MSRTANCLRMLVLLRSHNHLNVTQLAAALECNPRNIREYRKELEEAGYVIHVQRGINGGYELDKKTLFPTLDLTSEQMEALKKARDFMESQPSLPFIRDALHAMDTVLAQTKNPKWEAPIYFIGENGQRLSQKGTILLNTIREAVNQSETLEMTYLSRANTKPLTRKVDPYALICMEGRWYFCGFDHLHQEYRNYRISEQRIVSIYPTLQSFDPNPNFKLSDHIGQNTLVPSQVEEFRIEVRKNEKRFFEEIDWGDHLVECKEQEHGDWCVFRFESDNPDQVMRLLYSMKANVRLLAPQNRVAQYVKGMKDILANYQ